MPRNRIQWSEQEQMMAGAYANIASSFSQITAYMKNHLRTVQNGGGVINEGDMEEILQNPRAIAIYEGFKDHKAREELCRKCGYARRFSR